MRTAGPLPDASQVLLDRLAMAREPGPGRSWPGRQALVGRARPGTPRLMAGARPAATRPARRDHHLVRVRDGGIE